LHISIFSEAALVNFHALLHTRDPELHAHLVDRHAILPQFYAFRWISLLLSQEFTLPGEKILFKTAKKSNNYFEIKKSLKKIYFFNQ
jgi:hypothetical protein